MYTEAFFCDKSSIVARNLIGSTLVFNEHKALVLETEAYAGKNDPASHAFKGMTNRNAPMFQAPGIAYIYKIYGIHLCLNVTTSPYDIPGSVFIRCIKLCNQYLNGPGKLTKKLGITMNDNGRHICDDQSFHFHKGIHVPDNEISNLPRIGIKHGIDKLWRFRIKKPYSIE